jgi:type I restriction enzyme, R subunit
MITDINSEDRLVQATFADHLSGQLGWDCVYAWNEETFGPAGTLGRADEREVVLLRDARAALQRLNPGLPEAVRDQALEKLIKVDYSRSLVQHNREFYGYIRNGVPVEWREPGGVTRYAQAQVIDFKNGSVNGMPNNRFLAVRELKIQGLRVPHYNRRADLVCYVNGLPLVFIELKAVYKNIRAGFDNNLTDYMTEQVIPHAFHHNAFLVVSNGEEARYGSITSKWDHFIEWKRNSEKDAGRVDAETLLNGMLKPARLLDLVENFILFDDSRTGGTRKIIARNHQVLGVNNAVASVMKQEELKKQFPPGKRLITYERGEDELAKAAMADCDESSAIVMTDNKVADLTLVRRAHPDLGRLGVFWHTQGSGKSYSMAFFVEKVRRAVPGNFTFLVMTDREDLDDQLWRTFVGCGVTDQKTPRAGSGKELKAMLKENHRFVFSLIHKFNQDVKAPYSERDDIIVLSDEAHRTQAGKFAVNMRKALPNAAFIGFTGTPIFKHDHLTKRIFGEYVSRYDFKRSEEDNATVKLVYENRGEKLGIARRDLNERIAEKIEQAELDTKQKMRLEKLLGKDYEVITAPDRLEKLADDFVEHCATRWESGKAMIVCIDKITCGRMFNLIKPRWQAKLAQVRELLPLKEAELASAHDEKCEQLYRELEELDGQARWLESTIIEIIISEAQNEVRDFAEWGVDIVPHREIMKRGFETPDGKRVSTEDAFKHPGHPFRVAIVCAMWLTGFDVECLSTLYIDKPMKAHTLMQAIARANRVYPGKSCGVIVDYNGMLKSLRQALAQYALGDGADDEGGDLVAPIEELVPALLSAIETAEKHLESLGFDPKLLDGATGFDRLEALRDAREAVLSSDDARRRFEIMARQVFLRFKALLMEPSVFQYAHRHDNLEAIYKKLQEERERVNVTDILKELHKIVNEAIRAQQHGTDHAEGLKVDLSSIDFAKLRDEFASKIKRKNSVLKDVRAVIEAQLAMMLANNPLRMNYYKRYQEIIAEYNREKDRATVEKTFADLMALSNSLDAEQRRAAEEGLSEDELALFDLLFKENISRKDRERVKQASKSLLASLQKLLDPMPQWTKNAQTQAEVEVFVMNNLFAALPNPPFSSDETEKLSRRVYDFIWQRRAQGHVHQRDALK